MSRGNSATGMRAGLLILYATETGNAEDVAERIGREAVRRKYKALVMSMNQYDARNLPLENIVIFVVSTTGQGDVPQTMKSFWTSLLRKSMPPLNGVQYAVFGLGDSGYQNFNVVAKKLDRRMNALGAKEIVPRGLGDDQHPSGYEGALDPWLASLWRSLHAKFGGPVDFSPDDTSIWQLDPPKYTVKYHEYGSSLPEYQAEFNAARNLWIEHERARAMVEMASGSFQEVVYTTLGRSPYNPVFAQVIRNVRLTDPSHEQHVCHLEFDLGDSALQYSPGEVVGLLPHQDAKAVDDFCIRCRLDPDAYVSVEPRDAVVKDKIDPVRVRALVEAVMDINSASPRRYLFEVGPFLLSLTSHCYSCRKVMMHFAQAEHEKERLQYFASPEGRDDLYNYNQRERRTVLEVLEDFPSVLLPIEWLLQLVPKLRPRYFSISSSLRAHPNEIHVTIAVVRWKTPFKRTREGLCSTWLSQLSPKRHVVPLWVTKGILKLPPPSVPLILVGPGTGCAPFRAFIEDRAAVAAAQPVAPVVFFFGCRYRTKDFLYEQLWTSLAKDGGLLSEQAGGGFFVAFSRDQPQKIYVQHKIREQAKLVWRLVDSGASIFISGSANRMPEDVATAFADIIESQGGAASHPLAAALLKQLERVGRYTVEVWS